MVMEITQLDADLLELEREMKAAVLRTQQKRAKNDLSMQVRAARQRVQNPNISGEEREDLLNRIEDWEQAYIWITTGIAAMIERKICKCCANVTNSPVGYYRHQIGREDAKSARWVRIKELSQADNNPSIAREVVYTETEVDFCLSCLPNGFDLTTGTVKKLVARSHEQLHPEVELP